MESNWSKLKGLSAGRLASSHPPPNSASRTVPFPVMVFLMPRPCATSWNIVLPKKASKTTYSCWSLDDQLPRGDGQALLQAGEKRGEALEPLTPLQSASSRNIA